MSRDDLIDLIRYLDREAVATDLEELSDEELLSCYTALRAGRLRRLLDRVPATTR
jgi:hypothetical protein